MSVCSVMQQVTNCGPISRASISKQTGLSKQTVSEIVAQLEADGWVKENGRTAGHVGRTATTYELVATAAFIASVDLGGTKVRAALADLSCNIIGEVSEATDGRGGVDIVRQIARLCRQTALANGIPSDRIRFATVGVPGAPDAATGRILMAPNIAGMDEIDFAAALEAELGIGIQVENDVNLAVLGENWAGCATDVDDVVFISLGTGIGAGVLINGKLVRGISGAAGEAGFLPFGADPFDPASRKAGALERFAGSAGMRDRYAALTRLSLTVPEIFDLADTGDAAAIKVLDETADELAKSIAAIGALLDPSLVVLGGSIGTREALYQRIVEALPKCFPRPIRIERSELKSHAALVGGAALGLTHLHQTLFAQGLGIEVALPPPAINLMSATV
jgi:predicted NBD/HSP70 family sugar kinase